MQVDPFVRKPLPISGCLEFDVPALATGLGLSGPECLDYFRDGRRAQPLAALRLLRGLSENGWRASETPGGGRKLMRVVEAPNVVAEVHDVRVLVEELSFAPSWMKGVGRDFNVSEFLRYYSSSVAGVFVVDVKAFPRWPYWRVGNLAVQEWMASGLLGKRGSVAREDLPKLLEGFAP